VAYKGIKVQYVVDGGGTFGSSGAKLVVPDVETTKIDGDVQSTALCADQDHFYLVDE